MLQSIKGRKGRLHTHGGDVSGVRRVVGLRGWGRVPRGRQAPKPPAPAPIYTQRIFDFGQTRKIKDLGG